MSHQSKVGGNVDRDGRSGQTPSRGEQAMYGDLAYVVRQVSTAYVALTEARDELVSKLQIYYEQMHLAKGEAHSFGTAPEGAVRGQIEDAFSLVGLAEMELQKALFGVTEIALERRRAERAGIDNLPRFADDAFGGRGEISAVPDEDRTNLDDLAGSWATPATST